MEKLTELEHWRQELQAEAHTLMDFFCEDRETMKLDECFQIFRDFCLRFNKAVQVGLGGLSGFCSAFHCWLLAVPHLQDFRNIWPCQQRG